MLLVIIITFAQVIVSIVFLKLGPITFLNPYILKICSFSLVSFLNYSSHRSFLFSGTRLTHQSTAPRQFSWVGQNWLLHRWAMQKHQFFIITLFFDVSKNEQYHQNSDVCNLENIFSKKIFIFSQSIWSKFLNKVSKLF